jgi:hypothetical protein
MRTLQLWVKTNEYSLKSIYSLKHLIQLSFTKFSVKNAI